MQIHGKQDLGRLGLRSKVRRLPNTFRPIRSPVHTSLQYRLVSRSTRIISIPENLHALLETAFRFLPVFHLSLCSTMHFSGPECPQPPFASRKGKPRWRTRGRYFSTNLGMVMQDQVSSHPLRDGHRAKMRLEQIHECLLSTVEAAS